MRAIMVHFQTEPQRHLDGQNRKATNQSYTPQGIIKALIEKLLGFSRKDISSELNETRVFCGRWGGHEPRYPLKVLIEADQLGAKFHYYYLNKSSTAMRHLGTAGSASAMSPRRKITRFSGSPAW
jgi:hypothetical protein